MPEGPHSPHSRAHIQHSVCYLGGTGQPSSSQGATNRLAQFDPQNPYVPTYDLSEPWEGQGTDSEVPTEIEIVSKEYT